MVVVVAVIKVALGRFGSRLLMYGNDEGYRGRGLKL